MEQLSCINFILKS